ncbi:hypothetical protein ACMGDK_11575 [Chryseobacterium sp. DT-3]|uniref:hypothetical protein n=1 Tax=Chryseobacterium sp. DT-3 TaxID=3396164 RepID=UPI003F1ACAAD
MTRETQINILDNLSKERRELMLKKSGDYASSDVLDNFKKAGLIAGITPEQQCLSLISTKVARLGNLLKETNKPNNESVSDSVIDLINYSELLYCLLNENNNTSKPLNAFPHIKELIRISNEAIEEYQKTKDRLSLKINELTQAGHTKESETTDIVEGSHILYKNLEWRISKVNDGYISLEYEDNTKFMHEPISFEKFLQCWRTGEIIISTRHS